MIVLCGMFSFLGAGGPLYGRQLQRNRRNLRGPKGTIVKNTPYAEFVIKSCSLVGNASHVSFCMTQAVTTAGNNLNVKTRWSQNGPPHFGSRETWRQAEASK